MFAARQWKAKPETLDQMLDTIKAFSERTEKPFLLVLHPAHEMEFVGSVWQKFNERQLPVFQSFERAAAALKRVYDYEQR